MGCNSACYLQAHCSPNQFVRRVLLIMVLSTTRLPAERKGITKWSCLNPGVDQACGKEISICLSVWICFLALLPTKPFTLQISHSSSQNRKRSEGPQNENWPAGLTHFPLSQQLSLAKHAHQTNIPSARHHSTVFSVICWEHNTTLLPFLTQKFQFSSAELYYFFLFVTSSFIHPTETLSVLQKQTQRKRMTEELRTSLKKLHSLIFL